MIADSDISSICKLLTDSCDKMNLLPNSKVNIARNITIISGEIVVICTNKIMFIRLWRLLLILWWTDKQNYRIVSPSIWQSLVINVIVLIWDVRVTHLAIYTIPSNTLQGRRMPTYKWFINEWKAGESHELTNHKNVTPKLFKKCNFFCYFWLFLKL